MTHTPDLRTFLVRRLGEERLALDSPIAVAELHRHLVPYPVCRDALGLATKAEYDIALLRLLADDSSLEVGERALRDAVIRELETPEPGLAVLQRFAASEVRITTGYSGVEAPAAVEMAPEHEAPRGSASVPTRAGDEAAGPPPFTTETERLAQERIPGLDDLEYLPEPPAAREDSVAAARARAKCRACATPLPTRQGLRFCPGCGADQHRWPCESCGAEVESGWRFCAMCGTAQSG